MSRFSVKNDLNFSLFSFHMTSVFRWLIYCIICATLLIHLGWFENPFWSLNSPVHNHCNSMRGENQLNISGNLLCVSQQKRNSFWLRTTRTCSTALYRWAATSQLLKEVSEDFEGWRKPKPFCICFRVGMDKHAITCCYILLHGFSGG